jgi:carbon monoxide dehydrogenase subunit G
MLLKVNEDLHMDAAPAEVWALLRDTARLAGLLPGVESVTRIEGAEGEAYSARASEKVGPFKITMNLEVRVTEMQDGSVLKAAIKGGDSVGLNRVTGSLQIALTPDAAGTAMRFEASIEVLGKMATLGAVPIRRRTAESFAQFAKNIQGQFAKERS